jgi:hypothetical protein
MTPLREPRAFGLPSRGSGRRWWAAPVVAVLALLATGCQSTIEGSDDDREPVTLVVSETWVRNQASGSDVQARIRTLKEGIDRLRKETRTGWTGRQDDVTGLLGELSGGAWPGQPDAFMDAYGAALFGLDSSTLRFDDPDTETVPTPRWSSPAAGRAPAPTTSG